MLDHFILRQQREVLLLKCIIEQDFVGQMFELCAERDDLRGDDHLVAKMGVVLCLVLKEALHFGTVIDWKQVFDPGVFELGMLVLLFPPVNRIVDVVVVPHFLFDPLFSLHLDQLLYSYSQ